MFEQNFTGDASLLTGIDSDHGDRTMPVELLRDALSCEPDGCGLIAGYIGEKRSGWRTEFVVDNDYRNLLLHRIEHDTSRGERLIRHEHDSAVLARDRRLDQ